jgi:hypothetical protein
MASNRIRASVLGASVVWDTIIFELLVLGP